MNTTFTSTLRRRDGSHKAFTLIEIVLVLAIIALLVGAGIFKLSNVIGSGQKRRVDADLSAFKVALNLYRIDAGTYPTTEQGLKALVEKPTTGNVPKDWVPHMDSVQLDPWGMPYGYRFPPTQNRNKGEPDIWSFGPDMTDGTEDDITNWED